MIRQQRNDAAVQEVGPVSPARRGDRVVVDLPLARDLLGLLGRGLLLSGLVI